LVHALDQESIAIDRAPEATDDLEAQADTRARSTDEAIVTAIGTAAALILALDVALVDVEALAEGVAAWTHACLDELPRMEEAGLAQRNVPVVRCV